MQNFWGCSLVNLEIRRNEPQFSTLCDKMLTLVPGYKIVNYGLTSSGTYANSKAMEIALGDDRSRCLIALGSYVGGIGHMLDLGTSASTSNFEKRFGLIKLPAEASDRCKKAAVPMPYHIPNSTLNSVELCELETKCLVFLERKLLLAALEGRPYEALMMEYILTGCGAELSSRFLRNLGLLLKRYGVIVIADEVMTGCRVGPGIVMTLSQPAELKERVKFITLGKVFDCGITLQSLDYGVKSFDEYGQRGLSTELEVGTAYARLSRIEELLLADSIAIKQAQVFKALKLNGTDTERVWGRGLLLFSSKGRAKATTGLRHRFLAQLEPQKKNTLGSLQQTEYTSSYLNEMLFANINVWLETLEDEPPGEYSQFMIAIANFVLSRDVSFDGIFRVEDILEYLGDVSVKAMETSYKKRKRETLGPLEGRCSKNITNLFHEALRVAIGRSNGYIDRQPKGKSRRLSYMVKIYCDSK